MRKKSAFILESKVTPVFGCTSKLQQKAINVTGFPPSRWRCNGTFEQVFLFAWLIARIIVILLPLHHVLFHLHACSVICSTGSKDPRFYSRSSGARHFPMLQCASRTINILSMRSETKVKRMKVKRIIRMKYQELNSQRAKWANHAKSCRKKKLCSKYLKRSPASPRNWKYRRARA